MLVVMHYVLFISHYAGFGTHSKLSNFWVAFCIVIDGTTYQTIQSGGGPLCKMGQPTSHASFTPSLTD